MKVAIAGGTTSVGLAIVDGLKARGKFEYTILSRKPHAHLPVLVVDYDDIDGLTAKLEEAEVHVVISTLSIGDDASGQAQLNLIEAANRSKCTKRFLPSEFGIQYTPERLKNITAPYHYKFDAIAALEKTDLEFSLVSNSVFLDYWAAPAIPSHLSTCAPLWLDFGQRFAALPGDGSTPLVLTHTRDVGLFTAALLELPRWERKYTIRGDRLTLNEAVRIAEEVMDVKFTVVYDDAEKLRGEGATMTPTMLRFLPEHDDDDDLVRATRRTLALSAFNYLEGAMDLDGCTSCLNAIFPEIKPLTVRGVAEAWKENLQ